MAGQDHLFNSMLPLCKLSDLPQSHLAGLLYGIAINSTANRWKGDAFKLVVIGDLQGAPITGSQ